MSRKEYLGDSVYVDHANGMLTLTTENGLGASNTIHLEADVMNALIRYVESERCPKCHYLGYHALSCVAGESKT